METYSLINIDQKRLLDTGGERVPSFENFADYTNSALSISLLVSLADNGCKQDFKSKCAGEMDGGRIVFSGSGSSPDSLDYSAKRNRLAKNMGVPEETAENIDSLWELANSYHGLTEVLAIEDRDATQQDMDTLNSGDYYLLCSAKREAINLADYFRHATKAAANGVPLNPLALLLWDDRNAFDHQPAMKPFAHAIGRWSGYTVCLTRKKGNNEDINVCFAAKDNYSGYLPEFYSAVPALPSIDDADTNIIAALCL